VALTDDELDAMPGTSSCRRSAGSGSNASRLQACDRRCGRDWRRRPPRACRAGVGRLTIIDGDTVDLSNLQRQPLYRTGDIGQPKAALAAAFVADRNPHVAITAIAQRVTPANAEALLAGHDLILDGTDNFATRLLVSDTATRLGIPLLSAAAQQFQGQVALFRGHEAAALLPLLRRRRFRRRRLRHLRGAWRARRTYRHGRRLRRTGRDPLIVGITPDARKLHLFDGASLTWRTLNLTADPACKACGG
jgi:adenylyltransferase/sulfurtransferase